MQSALFALLFLLGAVTAQDANALLFVEGFAKVHASLLLLTIRVWK
jgi:hypothetical protein